MCLQESKYLSTLTFILPNVKMQPRKVKKYKLIYTENKFGVPREVSFAPPYLSVGLYVNTQPGLSHMTLTDTNKEGSCHVF